MTFGENFQLRVLQKLPARFYFTSSTETSFRYESNPFQFPTKRRFERELGQSFTNFSTEPVATQRIILHQLSLPSAGQGNFFVCCQTSPVDLRLRRAPGCFGNYFMIRELAVAEHSPRIRRSTP